MSRNSLKTAISLSDGGGVPVLGPEVEWDEDTRKQLQAALDEMERAQLVSLQDARNYWVKR